MAQVARTHRPTRLIDKDLQNLLGFWSTVPELVEEWAEWDEDARLDFIHEWPIERETLQRAADACAAGLLDSRQEAAWRELSWLIETHRATVESLLGEPI
jgi:hypothetical protein